MATFFFDYQQLVMQAYEQKMLNNTLPHGLTHLTPANLKNECMMRCTENVSRKDEKVIRDFCEDLKEPKTCHAIIQRCNTDKFRPLVNYLKGRSESTDERNIELLAWLIDFSGRPWEMGKNYSDNNAISEKPTLNVDSPATEDDITALDPPTDSPITESDKAISNPIIPENSLSPVGTYGSDDSEPVKTEETSDPERKKGKSTKQLATAVLLSLVLGSGSILWWKDKYQPLPSGSCMYWHEDHYEAIACNQKIPDAMVIALDTMRLKNFRKITKWDTITYQAIGKVWYSKINGKLEYYTLAGEHPVVFDRQLKPITVHIIDKYILSN